MLKFKMPKASVINRMRQDGIDPEIIEEYEETDTLPGAQAPLVNAVSAPVVSGVATPKANAANDELKKYRTMLKIRQPIASIVNRMRQDGIDKNIIAEFEETGVLPGGNAQSTPSPSPPSKEDAEVCSIEIYL